MTEIKYLKRKNFTICSGVLDRLEQCPASGVYVSPYKEKPHYGQWYGIFVHRFLEYCVTRGHDAALAYIRSKKMASAVRTCERIDPDQLYYGEAEVGWGHNPFNDTARRIPHAVMETIDWQTEQFGKADGVITCGVPRPLIVDYKCGEPGGPDPADRPQLLGLAASFRAESQAKEIDVAIGAVRGTGEIVWKEQTVDSNDLDRYVDRTKTVHLRILEDRQRADAGIVPDFVKGDQCDWCNIKSLCPAQR